MVTTTNKIAILMVCILAGCFALLVTIHVGHDPHTSRYCEALEFNIDCQPSAWSQFLLGDVVLALALGLLIHYMGTQSAKKTEVVIEQIESLVQQEAKLRKRHLIFVKESLKNYFTVILMITGLLNRVLKKASTYEEVPEMIRDKDEELSRVVVRSREVMNMGVGTLDPMLIEQIRKLLNDLEGIKPFSEVGKGFPKYEAIKDEIKVLAEKLDRDESASDANDA